MDQAFTKVRAMLGHWALVSTLIAGLAATWPAPAAAHEVDPTVADLTLGEGRAELSLRITLEGFIAGIDLDTATDVNDTPQAAVYDGLRALSPEALAERFDAFLPDMLGVMELRARGAPVSMALQTLDIPDVPDTELPRASRAVLTGDLPAGTNEVTLHWPQGYGTLILRQMGVEDGFTGFLAGGTSSPAIAVPDAMQGAGGTLRFVLLGVLALGAAGLAAWRLNARARR